MPRCSPPLRYRTLHNCSCAPCRLAPSPSPRRSAGPAPTGAPASQASAAQRGLGSQACPCCRSWLCSTRLFGGLPSSPRVLVSSPASTSAACWRSSPVLCRALPTACRPAAPPSRPLRAAVQLAPTQLDALDCIALDYRVGWPLSAILTEARRTARFCGGACKSGAAGILAQRGAPVVHAGWWPLLCCVCSQLGPAKISQRPPLAPMLPQDTLQGYAAVFCAMARVRRVAQLLRALHKPLASQPRSTADLLLRWARSFGTHLAWWCRMA